MARLICTADFRREARRRLPRAIYDFVDGGAGDEVTVRANEAVFDRITFRPEPLVDVSRRDQSATVLGRKVRLPILLGPTSPMTIMCPDGELAAARAAARMGTVFVLSTAGTRSIEEVAQAGAGATLWFQVYLWRSRDLVRPLVERAERAGYHALCLTVDLAARPRQYRNLRNGLSLPLRLTTRTILETLRHPRWLYRYLSGPPVRFKNLSDADQNAADDLSLFKVSAEIDRRNEGGATWEELRWLRQIWKGPLVVKGVLTGEAARRAVDLGADAVICSNHGGRFLDATPASLDALPEIVEAVAGSGKEVYLDGGIRRGGDAVKAIAMGARACLIGRPYLWGLAVNGEKGAIQVLEILRAEIDSVLGLLGRPTLAHLDRTALNLPCHASTAYEALRAHHGRTGFT